jgi:integrase
MGVSKDTWGYGSDLEHQCVKLFNENADAIGESRREAKDEAIASGAKNFTEIAQKTDVSSFGTANTYVPVWKELARFAEQEKGIKNICDISNKTVKQFLHNKMHNDLNKYTSYSKVISAVNKMSASLNKIDGVEKNWTNVTDKMREVGRHHFGKQNDPGEYLQRGFINPKDVVDNIDPNKPDMALVAQVQYEAGTRIHESVVIKEEQLKGLGVDPATDKPAGLVDVVGKGGREREIYLSPETYNRLESRLAEGDIKIAKTSYTNEIRDAAARAGQPYTGTHDFRHSWVQDKMKELINEGYTRSEARFEASEGIGHSREYITETYT